MPDITMCRGGDCSAKNNCHRYRAVPSPHRQSYFVKPPYIKAKGFERCDYYTPIHAGDNLRPTDVDDAPSNFDANPF